jgi:hypothetical protein
LIVNDISYQAAVADKRETGRDLSSGTTIPVDRFRSEFLS